MLKSSAGYFSAGECSVKCAKKCKVDLTSGVLEQHITYPQLQDGNQSKTIDVVTYSLIGPFQCERYYSANEYGLSAGAIAGITVGCVLFVALIIVAVIVVKKIAKRKTDSGLQSQSMRLIR